MAKPSTLRRAFYRAAKQKSRTALHRTAY